MAVERLTMTINETAEALGVSRASIYEMARTGKIPTIRVGERRILVPRDALKRMLDATSTNAAKEPI